MTIAMTRTVIAAMAGAVAAAVTRTMSAAVAGAMGITVIIAGLQGSRGEEGEAGGKSQEGCELFHDMFFCLNVVPRIAANGSDEAVVGLFS